MFSKRSTSIAKPTRLRRGLSVLVGALVVGAVAASPAAATFGAPFDLSAAGQDASDPLSASDPQVAVDANGNAVFAWQRFDGANYRVQARARSAAGVLSAVQTLSSSGRDAVAPQVAVDAKGNAVFTWIRSDGANLRVQARARSAAGALSAVQTLSAAGSSAFNPQVAVDANGNAVFAWQRFDGANRRVQARARSAAGVLSAVQDISEAGQDAFNPHVAVDTNGVAVFAWRRSDGANSRVQTRVRGAGGALSAVQTLSAAGRDASEPQLAVNGGGKAVFTWLLFDSDANYRAQARARSAAGALSGVQNLSAAGQDASDPRVAVDGDGDAVFAWQRFDGANLRVQARARSAAGALSPVQDLSAVGQDAAQPRVGVDTGGDAVFAWRRADHPGVDVIQAREQTAAGALFAVQTLSDAERNASSPQVAVGAGGDAASTWTRFDGANWRVQAAIGP
jgi:hypothetical protein